ncbi:FixH family protein [Niallia sp. Krafla_26]|uniref:FixH family protein n=1 Tax=Niallia sp. Krafla_26 TaxID=3064703 RepID=UPI003D174242
MGKRLGRIFIFLLFIGIGLLAACSQPKEVANEETMPAFLDVQLTVDLQNGQKNEPVLFQAKVTYGEKPVTGADEVVFEIWRAQDDNHEKIEIEHKENGIYELEKSFDEEGTYYIIAHVTAENMHNMPKEEFVIGQASVPEE